MFGKSANFAKVLIRYKIGKQSAFSLVYVSNY